MLCHSVRSCFSPLLSVKRSSVARVNLVTVWPPGVERTSGSFPRRPTRMTLLIMFFLLFRGAAATRRGLWTRVWVSDCNRSRHEVRHPKSPQRVRLGERAGCLYDWQRHGGARGGREGRLGTEDDRRRAQ